MKNDKTTENSTGERVIYRSGAGKAPQKRRVYMLPVMFFLLLVSLWVADAVTPHAEVSAQSGHKLAAAPAFSWASLLDGKWGEALSQHTSEEFFLRDEWVKLRSLMDTQQGKQESGGMWLAQDGYIVPKQEALTSQQKQKLPINVQAVRELTERHPGKVSVMIVPPPANILHELLPLDAPRIDSDAIMDEMFAQFADAGANVVDLRAAYRQQKDNYLFYRTDHHWTTTGGARIAFEEYCRSLGLAPATMPQDLQVDVEDFYGTNYARARTYNALADTMTYYDLPFELTIYEDMGEEGILPRETLPLMDISKLSAYDKYGAFLHGNNGYSVLDGQGEGSVLMIKDSYGNCFAPYLGLNFDKVGILDLRDWMSTDGVIEAGGYEQIVIVYSFNAFTNDMFANRMLSEMQR